MYIEIQITWLFYVSEAYTHNFASVRLYASILCVLKIAVRMMPAVMANIVKILKAREILFPQQTEFTELWKWSSHRVAKMTLIKTTQSRKLEKVVKLT